MFIVDKQIKEQCSQNKLIVENYREDNVGAVSYDLTVAEIIVNGENQEILNSCELQPNQTVFVATLETIQIPENYIGMVSEKNSVMREGLVVAAPIYQPGHRTKCFLRVTNVSSDLIIISKGKKIAQILFERLADTPEITYSQNPTASFNDEISFKGFGNYESEYKKEIKKIKKV